MKEFCVLPANMWIIPLFTSFYRSQVVQDFWTINSSTTMHLFIGTFDDMNFSDCISRRSSFRLWPHSCWAKALSMVKQSVVFHTFLPIQKHGRGLYRTSRIDMSIQVATRFLFLSVMSLSFLFVFVFVVVVVVAAAINRLFETHTHSIRGMNIFQSPSTPFSNVFDCLLVGVKIFNVT